MHDPLWGRPHITSTKVLKFWKTSRRPCWRQHQSIKIPAASIHSDLHENQSSAWYQTTNINKRLWSICFGRTKISIYGIILSFTWETSCECCCCIIRYPITLSLEWCWRQQKIEIKNILAAARVDVICGRPLIIICVLMWTQSISIYLYFNILFIYLFCCFAVLFCVLWWIWFIWMIWNIWMIWI